MPTGRTVRRCTRGPLESSFSWRVAAGWSIANERMMCLSIIIETVMHLLRTKPIRLFPLFQMRPILSFSTAPHHPTIEKILRSEDVGSLQLALG